MRRMRIAACLAVALEVCVAQQAQQSLAAENATLFLNVRVFDGTNPTLSPPSSVLVKGNTIERVSTEEAVAMTQRLAGQEGVFAGTSTGANVVAALRLAEQLGRDATVVTVMCDTGMKYLSRAAGK